MVLAGRTVLCTLLLAAVYASSGGASGSQGPGQCLPRSYEQLWRGAACPTKSLWNERYADFIASKGPSIGWSRHIVRFTSYQPVDTHRSRVTRAPHAPACASWRWVRRSNPAMKYPTDFGLIDVRDGALAAVKQWLSTVPGVRDLHLDRSLRHPLAASSSRDPHAQRHGLTDAAELDASHNTGRQRGQPQEREVGGKGSEQSGFSNVGPAHGFVADDDSVTKRPGRLSTRFSEGVHAGGEDAKHLRQHAEHVRERLKAFAAHHGRPWHTLHTNRSVHGALRHLLGAEGPTGAEFLGAGSQELQDFVGGELEGLEQGLRHLEAAWGRLGDLVGETQWEEEVSRRKALAWVTQVTAAHDAESIWSKGFTGKDVKVGVFDTGLRETHPHIRNLVERSNWTHENTLSDELGHGTFVAGVIGGHDRECPGFAPDVLIHTFKVFTNDQVSFTSWFLDAFNYALAKKMDIVNLSIGGPDFLDHPFVDKVLEITSNGMIMVSAIGNDGPVYGTLNNPADQLDVIGVGGIDYSDNIASFSSRGMSTWELPHGFGRSKPDVMAYGREVKGSKIGGGCRSLSGTSVASPVVAGAVSLLFSTVPLERRHVLNPASMKQALVEGATRIAGLNIFEQGQGKINLAKSMAILQSYKPRASVVPAVLDLTDCPYMWPYCLQPLYAHAQPVMFNASILNGMGVWGELAGPPEWIPSNNGGNMLDLVFEYSEALWPWSGHLSIFITVKPEAEKFTGAANGIIRFSVRSPGAPDEATDRLSDVTMTLRSAIIPTPPRAKRLLWDQFHSLKYPPAYLPRDNLGVRSDILDWHGDHLVTNFHTMYTFLRGQGIYVEMLGSPFTCFNASQYGALLIADSEEEFYPEEITKLEQDVKERGLGLLLFPEWYNTAAMTRMRFFDDNTRSWWEPVTGGGNIPALNDLTAPFGLALGDAVLQGDVVIGEHTLQYASGTHVIKAPPGAGTIVALMQDRSASDQPNPKTTPAADYHILALMDAGAGRIAAYGDANCIDSSHATSNCFKLLLELFQQVAPSTQETPRPAPPGWAAAIHRFPDGFGNSAMQLPQRPNPDRLPPHSLVRTLPMQCYLNSAVEFSRRLLADVAAAKASGAAPLRDGGDAGGPQAVLLVADSVDKRGTLDWEGKPGSAVTEPLLGRLLPGNPRRRDAVEHRHRHGGLQQLVLTVLGLALLGLVMWLWRSRRSRDRRSTNSKSQLPGPGNANLSPQIVFAASPRGAQQRVTSLSGQRISVL